MDKRRLTPTSLGVGQSFDVKSAMYHIKTIYEGYTKKPRYASNITSNKEERRYKSMRITFKESFTSKTNPNPAGKTYSIVRVKGTALDGKMKDQEWTTQFFANNKDLYAQVKELKEGDVVDVAMVKNGNFWNPTGFTKVDGSTAAPTVNIPATHGAVQPTAQPTQEHAKSGRAVCMEMAIAAMGTIGGKMKSVTYMEKAGELADLINDYVEKKGMFQFDKETTSKGIPEVSDADDTKEDAPDPDDDLI